MKQTCDERGAPPWDKGIHRGARVDFLVFGKILRLPPQNDKGVIAALKLVWYSRLKLRCHPEERGDEGS